MDHALSQIIRTKDRHGSHLLDDWLAWASRSRLPSFVELARKIRLLMRMAFGFKNTDALIALALLALGGYRPDLPGRQAA